MINLNVSDVQRGVFRQGGAVFLAIYYLPKKSIKAVSLHLTHTYQTVKEKLGESPQNSYRIRIAVLNFFLCTGFSIWVWFSLDKLYRAVIGFATFYVWNTRWGQTALLKIDCDPYT